MGPGTDLNTRAQVVPIRPAPQYARALCAPFLSSFRPFFALGKPDTRGSLVLYLPRSHSLSPPSPRAQSSWTFHGPVSTDFKLTAGASLLIRDDTIASAAGA